MKALFDNNLSPHLARGIAAFSKQESTVQEVVHLRDKFASNAKDADWLAELGREGGWVVISQDHFKKHSLERLAIVKGGLITFVLEPNWTRQQYWSVAQNLVRWWPAIVEQSTRIRGGAAFWVPWKFSGQGRFKQITL